MVPWEIAEQYIDSGNDVDIIQKWKDLKENDHYYKEGDAVAHTGNLKQKMFVSDLLFGGKAKEGKKKSMFTGLYCHWFETILYNNEKSSE